MFREMRRKAQQLSQEAVEEILKNSTYGVLALSGDDGYPYAVPLNYAYLDGNLYFHCAKEGHKLDALQNSDKASFCITSRDMVVAEEYTTHFESVIAFGRVRPIEADAEKYRIIELIAKRFNPHDSRENRDRAIGGEFAGLAILEMEIEHITGKQSKYLMKRK